RPPHGHQSPPRSLRERRRFPRRAGGQRKQRTAKRRPQHSRAWRRQHHIKSVRYLRVDSDHYTSIGGHRTDDVQGNHATSVAGTSQLTAPKIVFESSETTSCKSTGLLLRSSTWIVQLRGMPILQN